MNTSISNFKDLLKGGLYTLFITILIVYLFPILIQSFELKITDLKFNLRSNLNYEPSMNSSFAIVEIDDNSKKESGLDLWPYSYYADVLNNIAAGNPNSIGADILFTVSIDTLGWEKVIDVMFEAGNIINPYEILSSPPKTKLLVPVINLPACGPTPTLPEVVVIAFPDKEPIKVLFPPVVTFPKASLPTATLLSPCEIASIALLPMAVL